MCVHDVNAFGPFCFSNVKLCSQATEITESSSMYIMSGQQALCKSLLGYVGQRPAH